MALAEGNAYGVQLTPLADAMRDFEILFDHAERSELLDPVFARYGRLGFPAAPADRPWIYSNFVQSIDGVVSFLGVDGSGQDMSQSAEDRWLMDLLRAHADAVLLGLRNPGAGNTNWAGHESADRSFASWKRLCSRCGRNCIAAGRRTFS